LQIGDDNEPLVNAKKRFVSAEAVRRVDALEAHDVREARRWGTSLLSWTRHWLATFLSQDVLFGTGER